MTIYDKYGDPLLEVTPDDTSYRHREVMGDDTLVLKFSSATHVEIPVGSTCEFGGETYTLARPEALTMRHSRDFEYTVTFEGPQYRAEMWKFRDLTDGRLKFSLTAKPSEHLKLLIDNLNDREGAEVWTAGDCIDGAEACIGYDHVYCSEALALMADAFGTEWEINGATRAISLGKVEHGRDNPVSLSYGKGNGFLPDVGRSNSSDTPPCEILYAQGGSDNIDAGKYPQDIHRGGDEGGTNPKTGEPYPGDGTGNNQNTYSSDLLLPPGRRIGYDGEDFYYEGDEGWDGSSVRHYVVDEKGYSIRRDPDEKPLDTMAEDSLDCSDIYPKRVGTVAEVLEVENTDGDVPFYDFTDPEIGFDYNDYVIGEGPLTVIFQSGNLAGKEFDVTYVHEAADGKEARRFEVVQQEIDGVIMPQGPGEAFGINPGDTYAVFGCMLPDAYICQDSDHSGAEWDMLRQCAAYMYDHEQENHTITGKLDAIWAKGRWESIEGRMHPGNFVRFADARWQREYLLIRIAGVKDYLNSPYSPELELSNESKGTGVLMKILRGRSVQIAMEGDFNGLSRRVDSANSSLKKDIDDALDTAERYTDNVIDDTVEYIDGKFDDAVNYTDNVIDDTVKRIDQEVGSIRDDLEGEIGDVSDKVDTINDNLTVTQNTVSGVEEKVSALEGTVTDIEGSVTQVQTDTSELTGRVAVLEDDMADVDGHVATIVDSMVAEAKEELEAYTDETVKNATDQLEGSIGTLVDGAVSGMKEEIEGDMTAYTDSAVSSAKVELEGSISKVADDATAYTDNVVSSAKVELEGSISKVESDANAYTDEQLSAVKVELEGDISAVSDKADAVASDLKDAKDELEGSISKVADDATAYTDEQLTAAKVELEGSISKVESDANAYTDNVVSSAKVELEGSISKVESDANAYTDNVVSSAKVELEGSISKVESDANAYTDNVVSSAKVELEGSISKVESDANAYTDNVVSSAKDELNASIADVSDKADAVASDLSSTKVELETSISAVSDKTDAVASDLKDTQDTVSTLEGSVSTLEGTVAEVQKDASELTGRVSTVEAGLAEAESEVSDLGSKVTTLEGEVAEAQADVAGLKEEVTAVDNDLTDLNAQIFGGTMSNGTHPASTIDGRLTDAESGVTELDGKVATLEEEAETLTADVGTLTTNVGTLGTDVSAIIDSINGTDDATGIVDAITALQKAVELLNEAVNELDNSFTGGDTGGTVGKVDPGGGIIPE